MRSFSRVFYCLDVNKFLLNTQKPPLDPTRYFFLLNPEVENLAKMNERDQAPRNIGSIRNEKEIEKTQDEIDDAHRVLG